jgi:peptidoglycan hydrolase-like protein with peptidoglycan-binding domain
MSKRNEFVNIAKSQIGIKETGTNNVKYNTWYYGRVVNGTPGTSEYAWCVTFECWCANQIGVLGSLIPKCNNVGVLRDWYKVRGLYHLRGSYTPQKGDLIIFKNASHTGIIERVEGNRIWTIEGNSKDKVSNNTYLRTDSYIQGYCQVKFNDNQGNTGNATKSSIKEIQSMIKSKYNFNFYVDGIYGSETKKMLIKALQTELNKQYNANLNVDGVFGNKTKSKCPIVKNGAKGNITLLIQCKLVCLGYNISTDGVYGNQTKNAIIQFQKSHGLLADGICGRNTFEKLFK